MVNKTIVEKCLEGMDCKNCVECQADKVSWSLLEQELTQEKTNFHDTLQKYYQVRSKRKIFEQKQRGDYLVLSEPESLNMFARY